MAVQFTRNGRKSMLWAQVEAMRRGDYYVQNTHLLLGLLHGEDTGALRLLDRLGLADSQVRAAVTDALPPASATALVESSQLSQQTKKIVEEAQRETEQHGDEYVGTEHLLLALLRHSENSDENHKSDTANGNATDRAGMNALQGIGLTYARASAAMHMVPLEAIEKPTEHRPVTPHLLTARPGFLKDRHLLSVGDLADDEIKALFEMTREIKSGRTPKCGQEKTLALLFEKPSLRTRVSFSVAMTRLGGANVTLNREEIGMGTREAVSDVARGLSRWVDAVAVRTFADATLREFAQYSTVPVLNALTDREHPCQALADFYTILEHRAETAGMKLVYVGDGNNVAHSLMLLAPRLGTHFTLACPPGYEPDSEITAAAQELATIYGTRFEITSNPLTAADDADILYTDVWTSMGQEEESEKRIVDFAGFQINDEMIREAKDDVLVLHCLPAHRGEEITASVLDGPHSAVFDQAENRLHIQQALLAAVL